MRLYTYSKVFFLFILGVSAQSLLADNWQTVNAEDLDDVSISLQILEEPSLEKDTWIKFEFLNKRKENLKIKEASYNIAWYTLNGETEAYEIEGNLVTKDFTDVLNEGLSGLPFNRTLPPGLSVISHYPSAYGAFLLGNPQTKNLPSQLIVSMTLELQGDENVTIIWDQIDFKFDWYPVKNKKITEAKLVKALKEASAIPYHVLQLRALLEIQKESKILKAENLLKALDIRTGIEDGRNIVLTYLNAYFSNEKDVISFYKKKLTEGKDPYILHDLYIAPKIWSNEFKDILVEQYFACKHLSQKRKIIDILFKHKEIYKEDTHLGEKLASPILDQYESIIYEVPENLSEGKLLIWASAVSILGKLNNSEYLHLICPYLDSSTKILDGGVFIDANSEKIPRPLRVCDIALEAILNIQGKELHKEYIKNGFFPPYEYGEAQIVINKIRDKMVAEIKAKTCIE